MRIYGIAAVLILMPAVASAQSATGTTTATGSGGWGASIAANPPAKPGSGGLYGPPAPVAQTVSRAAAPTAAAKPTGADDSAPAATRHRGRHRGAYAGADAGPPQ